MKWPAVPPCSGIACFFHNDKLLRKKFDREIKIFRYILKFISQLTIRFETCCKSGNIQIFLRGPHTIVSVDELPSKPSAIHSSHSLAHVPYRESLGDRKVVEAEKYNEFVKTIDFNVISFSWSMCHMKAENKKIPMVNNS